MPSEYYNKHEEELRALCEKFEKDPREHVQVRAKRIRALLENERLKKWPIIIAIILMLGAECVKIGN